MSNREEMIAEATDLGIEFKGNISNVKLAELIAEFKGEPPPLNETPPSGPAVKAEPEADEEIVESAKDAAQRISREKYAKQRRDIAQAKERAFKTKVVTVTNRDSRENEHTQTVYVCVSNAYFTLAKVVPLDVPVELEKCLISNLQQIQMTIHKDEFKNGQRTGNKIAQRVPKYTISFGEVQPD